MLRHKKLLFVAPVLAANSAAGHCFPGCVRPGWPGPARIYSPESQRLLGIDQQKLADAFKRADSEFKAQQLANLVKEGKITSSRLTRSKPGKRPDPIIKLILKKFEAWLKSRPNVPLPPGPRGPMPPGMPPHLNMTEMLANLVKEGKITQQQATSSKPGSSQTRSQSRSSKV